MREEINLSTLFVLIGQSIKKNILLYSVSIVLGGLIGLLLFSFKAPSYKSSAIFQTTLFHPYEVQTIINALNQNIKNSKDLSKYKSLIYCNKIEVTSPNNVQISTEKLAFEKSRTFVSIEIETNKPELANEFGKDLELFFNSNTQFNTVLTNEKTVLEKTIKRLEQKINQTYSDFKNNLSIQEVNNSEKSLFNELAQAELALSELLIFKEVQPFYLPINPEIGKISLMTLCAILTLIVVIISMGIIKS